MKILFVFITAFILFANIIFAQPAIQWQKSYGGSDNDLAFDIQLTYDGGFIITGGTHSNNGDVIGNHGMEDYWIVKIDSIGNMQWQKTFGGMFTEESYSIIQTLDSGYIVTGSSKSNDGNVSGHHGCIQYCDDYWIVKLNTSGNIQWQKSLGGSQNEVATSVIQLPDQNYIVSGYTSSNDGDVIGQNGGDDDWFLKLDMAGNIIWQRIYGDLQSERAYSIKQTSDGGFVATGFTWSYGITGFHGSWGNDYWVIKLDSAGGFQWQKCLGGINFDESNSIEVTSDNGIVISGYVQSISGDVTNHNGGSDFWVVKLDSTGHILWQNALGGSYNEYPYSLSKTIDGGFIVAGLSASTDSMVTGNHGANGDYWITKLDSIGNLEWQKCLGGTLSDEARSVKQTSDGGFIIAGNSWSNDGDVAHNNGLSDFWVVKLFPNDITDISSTNFTPTLSVSPNPFSNTISIAVQKLDMKKTTFTIRNIVGQTIFTKHENNLSNIYTETIDLSSFSNGMLFLDVIVDGERTVRKIVKE